MPSAPALGGGTAVDLPADVFEQPFNGPLVHEVVVAELAARRQGTHATKTRGMVSGGGTQPRGVGRGGRPHAVAQEGQGPPPSRPLALADRARRRPRLRAEPPPLR